MSTLLSLTKSFVSLLLTLFRYFFYRAITSFLTGIVLFFVAVLMFVTFHQAYMPIVSHVKPVYLQFSADCQDTSTGLCSYPEANVFFTSENKANDKRMLMRGQTYKVFLDIEMPSSPTNEKLGMFMVNLKFLSAKGTVLKSSSRSCMLHYESSLVRLFRTIFYSLPLTLGFTEEKQKVEINFFEDYIDDSYNPAVQAKVVIMARQVEIYSSTLRLQASFTGLRYFIFNWPFLFSCIAVLGNFIVLTSIYSACINHLYSSSLVTGNVQQQTPQLVSNSSSQQNGITANCSNTRATTLRNATPQVVNVQSSTSSLRNENSTSSRSLISESQSQRTLTPTANYASSKVRNRQIPLSGSVNLTRKRVKIKNHKIVKIGIANQQETRCVNEQSKNNIPSTSTGSPYITHKMGGAADSGGKIRNGKNRADFTLDVGISENENKNFKIGIKSKKKKKQLSGKQKQNSVQNIEAGLQSSEMSDSEPETILGNNGSFLRQSEAMKIPRLRRLGKYLEENVPMFMKRVRHCISDLELSTIEENRFHVVPRNITRRSASTSDLTLKAAG